MDRPSPTDPPEDPVNRIASFLAPKVFAATPTDGDSLLSRLGKDLVALLDSYRNDPEGNHTTQIVDFANRYLGGVEKALGVMAIPIAKSQHDPILDCMVRDMNRHLSGTSTSA